MWFGRATPFAQGRFGRALSVGVASEGSRAAASAARGCQSSGEGSHQLFSPTGLGGEQVVLPSGTPVVFLI